MADRRRRQPQRRGRRLVPEERRDGVEGRAAAASRIGNERINENALQYVVPNSFAGSIFDLEPATEYECRFVLSDPDGVSGRTEQLVTVRTRTEPKPAAGGHVYHVYPPGYDGAKQEPAFTGLLAAYYTVHRAPTTSIPIRRACSPATRSWCTPASTRTIGIDTARGSWHGVDGTYFLTQSGTRRQADRDQGRGRRRGDLRRRRRVQPVQRDGRQLQLLRRPDDSQHRSRVPGRPEEHRRLERFHDQALPVRKRRPRDLHRLVGLEELLHRRQRDHRPLQSQPPDGLYRPHLARTSRSSTRSSSPNTR